MPLEMVTAGLDDLDGSVRRDAVQRAAAGPLS